MQRGRVGGGGGVAAFLWSCASCPKIPMIRVGYCALLHITAHCSICYCALLHITARCCICYYALLRITEHCCICYYDYCALVRIAAFVTTHYCALLRIAAFVTAPPVARASRRQGRPGPAGLWTPCVRHSPLRFCPCDYHPAAAPTAAEQALRGVGI